MQSAIQVLKKMEDVGLGSLREVIHPHNNKRSKLFVKTGFDDLHDEARAFLVHSRGITKITQTLLEYNRRIGKNGESETLNRSK